MTGQKFTMYTDNYDKLDSRCKHPCGDWKEPHTGQSGRKKTNITLCCSSLSLLGAGNIINVFPPHMPAQLFLFVIIHLLSAVKLQRTLQGSGFPMETPVQNKPFKIIKTRYKCTTITTSISTKTAVITIIIKIVFSHLCSWSRKVSYDVKHNTRKCKRIISDRHLIGQLRSGASRREKGRCSWLSARGATPLGEISASCTDEQSPPHRAGAKLSRRVYSAESQEQKREHIARLRGQTLTAKMCPLADRE